MREKDFPHMYEVLNRYGKEFVELAKMKLLQGGHNATGTLADMSYRVSTENGDVEVIISIEDYYKYLDEGTGPSHKPDKRDQYWIPIDVIRKWISVKRILPEVRPMKVNGVYKEVLPTVKQLPYIIQAGIHKNGTKATHFFSDTQKEIEQRFKESLEYAIEEDMEALVKKDILDVLY